MYIKNEHLSQTKQAILNSALSLFVKKGYFNTSIPDLVKHSGVSTGSIYHSFKDKEAIAKTLMDNLLFQVELEQVEILTTYGSSWERFYHLCEWMFQMAESHPDVMRFILTARHKEFLPDLLPICSAKPFTTLRNVIQQGMDEGVLQEMDVMVAAAIAYGGALRLVQVYLDGLLETPIQQHLNSITQTCWSSISTNQSTQ